MRRVFACVVIAFVLFAGLATLARAETPEEDQANLWQTLNYIDLSIDALRRADSASAKSYVDQAHSRFSPILSQIENVDNALRTRIENSYNALYQSPVEENIRAWRADIELASSKIGVSISPVHKYAILFILLISVIFALLVTLITKRVVNWQRVKEIKATVSKWQKELWDAQRKRDFKTVHKLQQQQKEMMALQGQVMMSSFKPAIFYMIPYFILWSMLSKLYSTWVVAWLPFTLPLPIIGTTVSLSVLGWFLISYFGFSYILRKLIIGD